VSACALSSASLLLLPHHTHSLNSLPYARAGTTSPFCHGQDSCDQGKPFKEQDEAHPYQVKEPLCEELNDVIVVTAGHGGDAS